MSRRILALVALLALVAALAPTASAQEEPITVTMWMHNYEPRVALDQELIPKFMEENPNIVVDYVAIDDFDSRLLTGLASGAGPDLFNQWTGAIGQFHALGTLAPVIPMAMGYGSIEEIEDLYAPGMLEGAMFGGELYGLPTELSIYSCFTNDGLWEAAGLDPAEDFPETWEEMIDVAQQLTVRDESGVLVQRGFDFNWTAPVFMSIVFDGMVRQLGGVMIDEENYVADINTPEVAQVMGYWNDWVNKYHFGGPEYTGSRDAFWTGELATECTQGNWGIPLIEDAGISWSLHPTPHWANGVNENAFDIYAYFLMVNSQSAPEVQEAAWKLAGYLTSQPDRYLYDGGLFQPRNSLVESEQFQQDPVMLHFFEEMSDSFFHPRIAGFDEVWAAMVRARDRVVLGGEDIEAVLAEAEVEINDILTRAQEEAAAALGD